MFGKDAAKSRTAGRVFGWVVIITVITAAWWALGSVGYMDVSADLVRWRTDVRQAVQEAEAAGKPMALYFGADWCPPCRAMRAKVFSQPRVAEAIERDFTPVQLDLTDRSATDTPAVHLARQFTAEVIPTLLLVQPNGQVIARRSGYIPADELLDWLAQSRAAP